MIKTVATVSGVDRRPTKNGGTMGLITADGKTYTTFDVPTIESAEGVTGRTVVIGYEEKRNGQYTNRIVKHFALADGDEPSGDSSDPRSDSPGQNQAPRYSGSTDTDWGAMVEKAAANGDWRAADSLQRRQDINRSVALNNSVKFLEYLEPKDRTPSNIRLIFDSLLDILAD